MYADNFWNGFSTLNRAEGVNRLMFQLQVLQAGELAQTQNKFQN